MVFHEARGYARPREPPLSPFSLSLISLLPSPLPVLNLGVNVTVGLYDFRIDGLAAWNARK